MTNPYQVLSKRALLREIENAPRVPSEDLIKEATRRATEIESGLCEIIAKPIVESGFGGHVLAGLLLIQARSLVSIPHFATLYRDPEKEPVLSPWFDGQIANIGETLLPPFRNLLSDTSAIVSGRVAAVDVLNTLAGLYPEIRDKVLDAIRSVVQDIGRQDSVTTEEMELLSWAVSALVDLGDRDSAELVRGLVSKSHVNQETFGEFADYAEMLIEGTPSPEINRPVRVLDLYRAVSKWDSMSAEEVVDHYKQAMLEAGVDEKLVTSLMSIALARFVGDRPIESGAEIVNALKATLSDAGVDEHDLDDAVKELLVTILAFDGIETDTILPVGIDRSIRLRLKV